MVCFWYQKNIKDNTKISVHTEIAKQFDMIIVSVSVLNSDVISSGYMSELIGIKIFKSMDQIIKTTKTMLNTESYCFPSYPKGNFRPPLPL